MKTIESYFNWLYSKIGVTNDKNPQHTYWLLCEYLFGIEFYWCQPNDDNRVIEALELQESYFGSRKNESPSVLEVLIALAKQANQTIDDPSDITDDDGVYNWFWLMLDNLGLKKYNDADWMMKDRRGEADHILNVFMHRQYKYNGRGGVFPLKRATEDQRKVELWYQLQAYAMENHL